MFLIDCQKKKIEKSSEKAKGTFFDYLLYPKISILFHKKTSYYSNFYFSKLKTFYFAKIFLFFKNNLFRPEIYYLTTKHQFKQNFIFQFGRITR